MGNTSINLRIAALKSPLLKCKIEIMAMTRIKRKTLKCLNIHSRSLPSTYFCHLESGHNAMSLFLSELYVVAVVAVVVVVVVDVCEERKCVIRLRGKLG